MRVRYVEPHDSAPWGQFVETSPSTTAYHQLGWKQVVEEAFGHRTHYLLAEDERGGVTGILPIVQFKSLFFGSYMVSLPFVNYGGLCSNDNESADRLLQFAIEIAAKQGASHIEFRDQKPAEHGLPVKTSKASMVMGLPQQAEQLWDAFPPKLRSQIRRPQKEGLYARVGGKEELGSFYTVFSANMRDLGTPVYSKRFFEVILETFPSSTWICTVYDNCQVPLASGFLIEFKEGIEIPWASSLREYNRLSPNMLLYWTALEHSCKRGAKIFDFGRSSPDSGTYKFKQQWGAHPKLLYWHYWLRDGGPMPELNPSNPKYRIAIDLWKRLPLAMTKLFGPAIVKNLP